MFYTAIDESLRKEDMFKIYLFIVKFLPNLSRLTGSTRAPFSYCKFSFGNSKERRTEECLVPIFVHKTTCVVFMVDARDCYSTTLAFVVRL